MISKWERVEGGILGLLVGDALGVPYEFNEPKYLPPAKEIEFNPPASFERSHRGVAPGTWSDDGAQALCLLASLLECGHFDADDFGRRMVRWQGEGYMAVNGHVFDIGITTSSALHHLRAGVPALEAGLKGDYDNGNGSLMRVLPLALWHQGTDEELVRDAQLQSRVTHGHLRSQICCALYCLWARYALAASDEQAWEEAVSRLRALYNDQEAATKELEWSIRPDDPPQGQGTGYVVDCLNSARWAVARSKTYEQVVRSAIGLGHDTDTTACVAGGIAGIRYGAKGIPDRWQSKLLGRELLDPLLEQLKVSLGG
jgi:ADP-ribosyl-[dinitrogen reductase] hydrolase